MAPTTGCVYTLHEKKNVLSADNAAATEEKDTTVIKAWLKGQNTISGMQMTLSKNDGANFPAYIDFLQKLKSTDGNYNTGFNTTLLSTKAWTANRFMFYEPSNRALMFDKVSKAIGNGNESNANAVLSGDVANFKDSFSISNLLAANISGNLVNIGTDVFTNMNKNDNATWKSTISGALYDRNAARIEGTLLQSDIPAGTPQKANTFAFPNSAELASYTPEAALKLPTNSWGTDGMFISEAYMVQGNKILSVALGTIIGTTDASGNFTPGIGIDNIEFSDSGDYSTYSASDDLGYNVGNNVELKFMAGEASEVDPGYTAGQSPQFYLHVDNTNLASDSEVVTGKYILKATPYYFETTGNPKSSATFVAAAGLKALTLTITKMSTSLSVSHQASQDTELTIGAKVRVRFKVTGGLNSPYAAGSTTTTIGSSGNGHIFVTDVYRKRIDNLKSSGVLYAEELQDAANGIDIITEKLAVANGNLDLYDQYGIYFNAQYEYKCRFKNTMTGEEDEKTDTVITKPGKPQNFQDKSVNDVSGFFLEWIDPLATGGVNKTYKVQFSNIKLTGNNYNKDGTQDDGSGVTEITYTINKSYSNIPSQEHVISLNNLYYPGVKLTANVKGNNSSGDGYALTSTSLTCLEAPIVESTAVSFVISVCQNPIQTDAANNLPVLTDAATYARNPSGGNTDSNFPAYDEDSFEQSLTHANISSGENANFVVLTVSSYTTFVVAMYDVYVDGKKYGSIAPSALTNSKIIIGGVISSGSDESKTKLSNESTHSFSIIARSTINVTNSTKHSMTSIPKVVSMHDKASMPKPLEGHSLTVVTAGQNKLTASVVIPANSFVSSVKFFKVKVPGTAETQELAWYDEVVTEIGGLLSAWSDLDLNTVTTNFGAYDTADLSLITTKSTNNTSEHTISHTISSLKDSVLYAVVAMTFNADGVRAGDGTPVQNEDGSYDYTGITAHFASTAVVSATAAYAYNSGEKQSIIGQGKTLAPKKSEFATVTPNGNSDNDFSVSTTNISTTQFSTDYPIQYKVEFTPLSISSDHSSGSTTFADATTVIIQDFINGSYTNNSYNTSNLGAWKNKFSKQLTGKVKVTSRTNMAATSYDEIDYTEGLDDIESNSFTLKSASYSSKSTGDYETIDGYSKNNKPCLKAEELVLSAQEPFQVEFQKFRAISVTGITGAQRTCPPSCMPLSKMYDSELSEKTTFLKLSSNQPQGGMFQENDCITVYNKDNGATLDTLVITADVLNQLTDGRTLNFASLNPGLTFTQGTGTPKPAGVANCDLFFSLWKSSSETFFPLEIDSFAHEDLKPQYQGSVTLTAGGSIADGQYITVLFKLGTMYVDFYEEGIHFDTKEISALADMENISPTITPTKAGNVTASLRHATDQNRNTSNEDESTPNIAAHVHHTTGNLLSENMVYSVQSMAPKVIYEQSSTELYLNNDTATQTIELKDNVLNFISFTVVDTSKTTIEELFETIYTQNSDISKIFVGYAVTHVYTRGVGWDTSGSDVQYEFGYYVRATGGDVDWTITGKSIRGLKKPIAMGLNYLGYPFSTTDAKPVFEVALNDTTNFANYWELINVISDKNGTPVDLRAGPSLDNYLTDTFTFSKGDGYVLSAKEGNYIELGTMAGQGLIGDINGVGGVDLDDVTILKEFLAATNPGYDDVNGLPSKDEKFELCDYNSNDIIDIGDAVILASKVAGESGFDTLPIPSSSQLTTYAPATYNGDAEAVKNTATLPA